MNRILPVTALWLTGALGCARAEADPAVLAFRVYSVSGFDQPESAQYDPDQDVFFVSNMAGLGSAKNGMGYISRFPAADPGRVERFIVGGEGGATLHSPKGMAIQGDTLWVADIDVLRGFDRRTGAPFRQIDLAPAGALLLNAVAVAPDGAVYVTDTGIVMSEIGVLFEEPGRIYKIGPGASVAVLAAGEPLAHPNGIAWDPAGRRLLVASFAPFGSHVYEVTTDGRVHPEPLAEGLGRFDGLVMLDERRFVYTAWSDSSLYVRGVGEPVRLIRDLWQPADVGVDTRRGRVAIPLVLPGRVEVWQVGSRVGEDQQ